MAKTDPIASVHIDISADSASVETAARSASQSLNRFAGLSSSIAGKLTAEFARIGGALAGAFAVDGLVRFGAEAIRAAADIGRFSAAAGLTAREFQGLEFALRDARVPTEALSQGFAVFSRNLSDMERNTGPLLDFLRRFAPSLEAPLRAANGTAEAFSVLTDAAARLGNAQDRVRLLNAAGAEQFGRLADVVRRGRGALDEAAASYSGFSDAAIQSAQRIERRFEELGRNLRLSLQGAIVGIAENLNLIARPDFERLSQDVLRAQTVFEVAQHNFGMMRQAMANDPRIIDAVTQAWQRLTAAWAALNAQTVLSGPIKVDPTSADNARLMADRIKAAQGELALYAARLQNVMNLESFRSTAFEQQWARTQALLVAQGATESQIAAARIAMLVQEDALRQQILGNSISLEETYTRRMQELSEARRLGIISENDALRGRAQLQMQSANVVAGALAQTFSALSQAFKSNKALQIASAVANTAQSITQTLATYGYTPWGIAAAAAAGVAGAAQIAAIRSAQPGSPGSVPSVGGGAGGATAAPATPQPQQAITIDLHGGMYTREEVRALLERVNEFTRDGGTLIATAVH